jgi:hypothetical protein
MNNLGLHWPAAHSNAGAVSPSAGVLKLLVPGTPDEVKEICGTPFERNLEHTFVLRTKKKVLNTA